MTDPDELIRALLDHFAPDDEDEKDDPLRRCVVCHWRGRAEGKTCPSCGAKLGEE